MNLPKIYFDGDKINIKHIIDNINCIETSYDNCDFIISCKIKGNISNDILQENISLYEKSLKSIIIFLISDTTHKFNIPDNVFLYRTSLYKSQKSKNEYLLPYVWENIDKPFTPLKKNINEKNYPIVGFCGQVCIHRKKIIEKLNDTPNIIKNFIIRKHFWGGKPKDEKLIQDFTNNILSSHFTICNRGVGNFSMRFYQVLSAGRIPVLINTDMVFPFEKQIKWNEIAIIGKTEDEVINKIFDWWKNKNIEDIQKKCKIIYDTYFDKKKFLNRLCNDVKNKNLGKSYGTHSNSFQTYTGQEATRIIDMKSASDSSIIPLSKKVNNLNVKDFKKESNKLPNDFNPNTYKLLYRDLSKLNDDQLKNHYILYGFKEQRKYKITLPNDFNPNTYKLLYRDLSKLNDDQLKNHYISYGFKEQRKYKE